MIFLHQSRVITQLSTRLGLTFDIFGLVLHLVPRLELEYLNLESLNLESALLVILEILVFMFDTRTRARGATPTRLSLLKSFRCTFFL